jgi:transposase
MRKKKQEQNMKYQISGSYSTKAYIMQITYGCSKVHQLAELVKKNVRIALV